MSWLLLFALTALVVLLPMLPALIEWRWPSDVTPLHIGEDDALDPPFLARAFASRLATAMALQQTHLGRSRITSLPDGKPWPFDGREAASGTSHRVWDLHGDIELPAGIAFLGEVAARGALRGAAGGVYRALWVRGPLQLAAGSTLLRWAHAERVEVGAGCELAGRVSADEAIVLAPGTRFVLLHAPLLRFAPGRPPGTMQTGIFDPGGPGLPAEVSWHAASGRGRCETSLAIEPGSRWCGDLVCAKDLSLGERCGLRGSLKAHGAIVLGAGCVVEGSLVARGPIRLGAGCVVRGPIVSEAAVVLGDGCVVGAPGAPCTVSAPRIEVAAGVLVHGTVWAAEAGLCVAQADAGSNAPAPAEAAARVPAASPAQEATA